ncbi:MAG: hypothetical protein ICV85_14470 [Tolypothrix sp. T3-bin4]|nr:hypothetical protein [Tolypothrix sp. T3-bin4]
MKSHLLTQKLAISMISIDDNPVREINSEEAMHQNAYVIQEIEKVLKDYPEHPYQLAFSIKELRSQLVAHVLRHTTNSHSIIGDVPESTIEDKFRYSSMSERLRLDTLIRGSIFHLLRENAEWISCYLQRLDNSRATH